MSKRKVMTHEEHVELSKILSCVVPALQRAVTISGNKLGVTNKGFKALCKVMKEYDMARSYLDSDYHAVTSNEQFAKEGHVYYGGRALSE
jgi:hypothetical protein